MASKLRHASTFCVVLIAATASLAASAAPEFQQHFEASFSNGGSTDGRFASQAISATSDVRRGDLIYLAVALSPLNSDIQSVDDNLGDDYQQAFSLEHGYDVWDFAIYWAIAKSSGPLTVSFNVQHFDFFQVHGLTYSGVRALNPIDPSSRNGGLVGTSMSCELASVSRGELLIAFMPSTGHVTGVDSNVTLREQLDGDPVLDRIVDSPGIYALSATTSEAPWYAQCIGLFANPLATTGDAGMSDDDGGTTIGQDGGVTLGSDGGIVSPDAGATARLSSNLGCSSTSGTLWMSGGLLLLLLVVRMGRTKHSAPQHL